ncbi:SDR family oxidoreductase [Arthrobacter sp. MA-N2]|uniref:SDR family oxidoreductase n=1 Tax=Arthrobacter sp. MA-N2 TaxID=1101188 RepID=UPI000484C6C2|nr:SDR family oxidoreductase [Arthrobacter sp. MA-N2]
MDLGITAKRALVIGGSSGLGFAAAKALAAEGVHLALFARSPGPLATAKEGLVQYPGVEIETLAGDITHRADVVELAGRLRESGGVDILILNTPRPPSPMREFLDEDDDERWSSAYRNQLQGALNVLREITPLIIGKGWGRIVGITSASVKQPMPRHAISTIFRSGVQAALKHLSLEIAEHGVTVNSIAPATIMTPTFAQFHNLEDRVAATPLKRFGTLEEFGGTVAFLASQQSGFLTGQVIQLDGGRTAALV